MKDTYTPMEIEGKIVVVVNAPEGIRQRYFQQLLTACTKYPTLEEHAEYWQGKLGMKMNKSEIELKHKLTEVLTQQHYYTEDFVMHAIPKKQGDGDLWDEAEHDLKRMNKGRIRPMGWKDIREYLKNNYQLIKRK